MTKPRLALTTALIAFATVAPIAAALAGEGGFG